MFARVADRARIVAARDRDPRTPAEALEGSSRRVGPRWRRRRCRRPRRMLRPPTPATTGAAAPAAAAPPPSGPVGRKAAAAPAPPPPPPPDPPYVAAAKSRLKIPFWAMAALSLMPIWLFMYVRSVTEPPEVAAGPLGVGAEIYSTCQSCHGAGGEGGVGRPFADGEVLRDVPAHRGPAALRLLRHRRVQPRRRRQLRQPRPRGRPAPGRLVRRDAPAGLDRRRRPDRRRDPRRRLPRALRPRRRRPDERRVRRGVRGLVLGRGAGVRRAGVRHPARRPGRPEPRRTPRATSSRSSRSATPRPPDRLPASDGHGRVDHDRRARVRDHDRRPRRRRRPGRRRGGLLAGPARPRRHRRREEGVPAREDVR